MTTSNPMPRASTTAWRTGRCHVTAPGRRTGWPCSIGGWTRDTRHKKLKSLLAWSCARATCREGQIPDSCSCARDTDRGSLRPPAPVRCSARSSLRTHFRGDPPLKNLVRFVGTRATRGIRMGETFIRSEALTIHQHMSTRGRRRSVDHWHVSTSDRRQSVDHWHVSPTDRW
jgi:hypothetical protein